MGDGFAIQPENGKIYSPISEKITALFPSGHAIGIQGDNSVEVLIHIGIDTVNMNGDGFKKLVKNGDYVEAGKPIVQVNLGKVKKAGYDPIVMVILTGGCDKKVSAEMYGKSVEVGDTIIEIS